MGFPLQKHACNDRVTDSLVRGFFRLLSAGYVTAFIGTFLSRRGHHKSLAFARILTLARVIAALAGALPLATIATHAFDAGRAGAPG